MKIILSKKGFDGSFGGTPSPVFSKDKTFISLPIPVNEKTVCKGKYKIRFQDLNQFGHNYGRLVEDLTKNKWKNKLTGDQLVHLDPDILRDVYSRRETGWQPLFGQVEKAQGHLRNQKVEKGDIFLFFGLYRWVEIVNGVYKYISAEKPFHMLWGWMQIDKIIDLDNPGDDVKPWMTYHPHFAMKGVTENTLYVGSKDLVIGKDFVLKDKGAGTFGTYREELQLTKKGSPLLTSWSLPSFFYSDDEAKRLTWQPKKNTWKLVGDKVEFTTVKRGQEFVYNCENDPRSIDWVKKLIRGE